MVAAANNPLPLEQLHDIQLPEAVSAWPPAPGWWLLLILSLVLAAVAAWASWRYLNNRRYRREALALLQQIDDRQPPQQQLQAINVLLKRVALQAYPAVPVASLYGRHWCDFLQRSAPGVSPPAQLERWLGESLYSADAAAADVEQLRHYARQWIAKHRRLPPAVEVDHAAV